MSSQNENTSVKGLPYFTPAHASTPGAPIDLSADTPTLFTPLKIRGSTLRNRIVVAPMCQYSTASTGPQTGVLTDYHVATLGHYALKGAGAVFIEATGVQPNGRISPNCPGLWDDAQIEGVRKVADFIKSQGALCGIQLAHAGRKASTIAPWLAARQKKASARASSDVFGWPDNVVGPMSGEDQTWDGKGSSPEGGFYPPRRMTEVDIQEFVKDFAEAAARSVRAGVDLIEVHAAHGYLFHQFLSPITNQRKDRYGGPFENRIRLLVEVLQAVRKVIPATMPLFVRISSTEWLEDTEPGKNHGSWDMESTIRLAKMLPGLGVDLLDVSSGGNHPQQRINTWNSKDYQTKNAARIRQELKREGLEMLIGAVGLITEAEQARDIVETGTNTSLNKESPKVADATTDEARIAEVMTDATRGKQPMADVVLVARQFMREPEWVLRVAAKLKVDVAWPTQFSRVKFSNL